MSMVRIIIENRGMEIEVTERRDTVDVSTFNGQRIEINRDETTIEELLTLAVARAKASLLSQEGSW
jgi:hypothetical protein